MTWHMCDLGALQCQHWKPPLNLSTFSLTLGAKPYDVDVTAPTEPAADFCPRFRFPSELVTDSCECRLGTEGGSMTATAISEPVTGEQDGSVDMLVVDDDEADRENIRCQELFEILSSIEDSAAHHQSSKGYV